MNKSQFQQFLYGSAGQSESERLTLQHRVVKPSFNRVFETILTQYGLAQRLQEALARHEKLQVLDAGCSEGLYLHTVAENLEALGLQGSSDLNGLDVNPEVIVTAQEFAKISSPPRPDLSFYVHDLTRPLEECADLRLEKKLQFDFIFSVMTLTFLQSARQCTERLYRSLAPGGVIYLRELVMLEGEDGWVSPHAGIAEFFRIQMGAIAALNPGQEEPAFGQAKWLKEAGAELVQARPDVLSASPETERGLLLLRSIIKLIYNSGPVLIAKGLMTQRQFDEIKTSISQEVNMNYRGHKVTYRDTLACKPLTAPANLK